MPKICPWARYQNRHSSKSIWVIKLSFCQKDLPLLESFWQKDSLITHILFELCLFRHLAYSTFFGTRFKQRKPHWSLQRGEMIKWKKKTFSEWISTHCAFFRGTVSEKCFWNKKFVQTPYNLHVAPFGNLQIINK